MPHGKISNKNAILGLTIPKTLKDEIVTLAQKENRSMSNLSLVVLDNYVRLSKNPELFAKYQDLVQKTYASD